MELGGAVEVTNFPEEHLVSGTVDVGNLPAVQQVSGEVTVANLAEICGGQSYEVLQVPAFVEACGPTTSRYASVPFEVAGWSRFTIYLQTLELVAVGPGDPWSVQFRHFPDDDFPEIAYPVTSQPTLVFGTEAIIRTNCANNEPGYPLAPSHSTVYLTK